MPGRDDVCGRVGVVGQGPQATPLSEAPLGYGSGDGVVDQQHRPVVAVAFRQVGLHGRRVQDPARHPRGLAHQGIGVSQQGVALAWGEPQPKACHLSPQHGVGMVGHRAAERLRDLPGELLPDFVRGDALIPTAVVLRGQQCFQDLVGQWLSLAQASRRAPGQGVVHE